MLQKGTAKKVTVYVNEDTQYHLGPLYEAILTFLLHKGVAGATASRAMAGFGAHQLMHTTKIEILTQHLPIRIEFIETAEKVDELLATLYDMVTDGLIEVQDTRIVKAVMKEGRPEPKRPHEERRSRARLMRIYMGEADKWHEEPLYAAIVKRLRMMDIAGATVYRGILGYGVKGHAHTRHGFMRLSRDLPIMIAAVDTEEKLSGALDEIETLMGDGIIVFSDVEVIRLVHSATLAEATSAKNQPR